VNFEREAGELAFGLRNLGSVDQAAKAIPLVNSNTLLAVISIWNLKGVGPIPAELPATLKTV